VATDTPSRTIRATLSSDPMLPGNNEDLERREVSRLAPRFHIELRADGPMNFAPWHSMGSIPLRKSNFARLQHLNICATVEAAPGA
jgi:hypothetical protein